MDKGQEIYYIHSMKKPCYAVFSFAVLALLTTLTLPTALADGLGPSAVGLCEKTFSDPESFFKAMTEGLLLREGQAVNLWALYENNKYSHPGSAGYHDAQSVLDILKQYPELSKLPVQEQILTFPLKERESPESLKDFIRSLRKSADRIRNNLFQVESNIGFWMKMLNFPSLGITGPPPSTETGKGARKKLKQQQKADFMAYLDTTALNQKTRDFIKNSSQPYMERAVVLYHALEEIRATLNGMEVGSFVPSDTETKTTNRIEQAMADLVHTVGFGDETRRTLLKSPDPDQSYEALRNILNDRDILAFNLGFEGHFAELTKSLNVNIPDPLSQLQQIKEDIQNQTPTVRGEETLRLRALSLTESPFRSCLAGDCATKSYFKKALDPDFLYFTLTDKNHRSSGAVTVVLGRALNHKREEVKVAFVDKIQNVPTEKLKAMLEGIRSSLEEHGYILALPKEVGDTHTGLSNEHVMNTYVKNQILPEGQKELKKFKPHQRFPGFGEKGYTRAYAGLPLLEFESTKPEEVQIKRGSLPRPQTTSPNLNVRSLFESTLSLEKSLKEEDQLNFLNHLPSLYKISGLNISHMAVFEHLQWVLDNRAFSFKVRKRAFFLMIDFDTGNRDFDLDFLNEMAELGRFSEKEIKAIVGEMSNWKNTTDYRKEFIEQLHDNQWSPVIPKHSDVSSLFNPIPLEYRKNRRYVSSSDFQKFKLFLDSPWSSLLDRNILFGKAVSEVVNSIARFLLDRGTDLHARDNYGKTALMLAVQAGNVEMTGILLDRGADIHATDNEGKTPLMFATQYEWDYIARLLLDRGANVHATDDNGRTALMYLVDGNFVTSTLRTLDLLLNRGADTAIENNAGESALFMVIKKTTSFQLEEDIQMILRMVKKRISQRVQKVQSYFRHLFFDWSATTP